MKGLLKGWWLTNDPKAAKALKRAEAAYERAREAASGLPLADKVNAYRAAGEALDRAHKEAMQP